MPTNDFRIVHLARRSHQNADVLSRRPCFETNYKHCKLSEYKDGTENTNSKPGDRVVNVKQAQVLEEARFQSSGSAREGKEEKGLEQLKNKQLSPPQFPTYQMKYKNYLTS